MNNPMDVQQIVEEGKQAYQEKSYSKAAGAFQQAYMLYKSQGDGLSAAEMANNRSVALLMAEDYKAAFEAVDGTEIIFAQAGDVRRQAMALGNRGAALEKLGRIDDAITAYTQAADLFKQAGEHELRAPVLKSLSDLQLRTGRHLESIITMNAGLEEEKKRNPFQRMLKKMTETVVKFILRT